MSLSIAASGTAARFGLGDIVAGVSVAVILIPQAIAYAALAGLPPQYGLYASILPLIVAAFFASSPYLQTGPVAMTSMLTYAALSALAVPLSPQYLALAPLLALVVGVVRVLTGAAGAGFIAYLMSQPVLTGFSSAAAILITLSQLPSFLGIAPDTVGILGPSLAALTQPAAWSLPAIGLGAFTVAAILAGRRLHDRFPGVLVAVVCGILYVRFGGYAGPVIGAFAVALPSLSLALPWTELRHLIVPGLVIAFVGFAEPATVARTLATQDRQPWSANRELLAQGCANIAAALSNAFPVGGSFSRTLLNRMAGGRTRWSGAVSGVTVLLLLPFAGFLADLPRAVLAGVVIAAVCKLIAFKPLWAMMRVSRAQAVVGWVTFVLTIALAPRIDLAVLVGIGFGIAVHLWRERRIHIGSQYDAAGATLRLEPVGVLYFGSANVVDDALIAELAKYPDADRLVLDLRRVGRIDYTGALVLQRLVQDATLAGLEVQIIPGEVLQGRRLLARVFGADSPLIERGAQGANLPGDLQ